MAARGLSGFSGAQFVRTSKTKHNGRIRSRKRLGLEMREHMNFLSSTKVGGRQLLSQGTLKAVIHMMQFSAGDDLTSDQGSLSQTRKRHREAMCRTISDA
jgi:hypothetical protein